MIFFLTNLFFNIYEKMISCLLIDKKQDNSVCCLNQNFNPLFLMANLEIKAKQIHIQLTKPNISTEIQSKNILEPTEPGKPNKVDPQKKVRVKSEARIYFIGLIITLSAIALGYSVKEITSIPIAKIILEYDIKIAKSAAQSILIGILPIGAIFGVIITKFMLKSTRRLFGMYLFAIVNVGAIVLVNITNFGTLIAGRFIQGICIGYYTTVAPIYLKQIAPKQLRKVLGIFFSLGKSIGVIITIILQMSFQAANLEIGWRIILSVTPAIAILQAVLLFFFGCDTPTQWFQKQDEDKARQIIKKLVKAQYVEQVFDQYQKEHETELAHGKDLPGHHVPHKNGLNVDSEVLKVKQSQSMVNLAVQNIKDTKQVVKPSDMQKITSNSDTNQLTFDQKKSHAYCLAVHLTLIRYFVGGQAVITQGGLFIGAFDKQLGKNTSIIINLIQLAFLILGLVYLQKIAGRRTLFLISLSTLTILNLGLAVSMIFSHVLASIFIMCIYMAVYGASYIAPVWSYPTEIVPAKQSTIPNIVQWLSLAISTLVPPLITGSMPNSNPYPIFIFYGIYTFIGFIHVFKMLKEPDGKSYYEIIQSFK